MFHTVCTFNEVVTSHFDLFAWPGKNLMIAFCAFPTPKYVIHFPALECTLPQQPCLYFANASKNSFSLSRIIPSL